jgi:phosphoribosylamine--glycine ligase
MKNQNILLLGSGGREHALAWKMRQSALCGQLFIAPGNAGTAQVGTNVPLSATDFEALKHFCLAEKIDMLVVGPEEPLVRGVIDFFRQTPELQHITTVGPSAEGAQLEGSKAYAKRFMARYDIPTARYREVSTLTEGVEFLKTLAPPFVLKADGLAAGKGVLIIDNFDVAVTELDAMLSGKFGAASSKVVIEEFLSGIEFSVFVLTDGKSYQILPVAKDYKRVGEGDTGLNTGGMGAVSPVPFVDAAMMQKVETRIIRPTVAGLSKENIDYKGFVFIGLISVKGEPMVIEYNCRMGDPETEVVMPRLSSDLVAAFVALGNGTLADATITEDPRTATTIMLTAGGYPEDYRKGDAITNITEGGADRLIFHAGTKLVGDSVVTNGGRVIALTAYGDDIPSALNGSNDMAQRITFEGKYYRRDIGLDLINL